MFPIFAGGIIIFIFVTGVKVEAHRLSAKHCKEIQDRTAYEKCVEEFKK